MTVHKRQLWRDFSENSKKSQKTMNMLYDRIIGNACNILDDLILVLALKIL